MVTWDEAKKMALTTRKLSKRTKEGYGRLINQYMNFHGLKPTDNFSLDPKITLDLMHKQFLHFTNNTKIKPKTMSSMYCALLKVNEEFEIPISKKQYDKFYEKYMFQREEDKIKENRGYRIEEIIRMADEGHAGPRGLLLIYLACSSGLREDALSRLTFGHLRQVEMDGKQYPNYWLGPILSKGRWVIACCSQEAFYQINAYRALRERFGEVIHDERINEYIGDKVDKKKQSPLIRNDVDFIRKGYATDAIKDPKPVSNGMVFKSLDRIARLAGVRQLRPNQEDRAMTQYVSAAVHGFRGFFETVMINARISDVARKLLMGHTLEVDKHYYDIDHKPSRKMVFTEYLKVQLDLTIHQLDRERIAKEEAQTIATKVMGKNAEYEEAKRRFIRDHPEFKDEL